MKTNTTPLKLLAALALTAFTATSVQAVITYDFNGNSLQGWHNRVWDGTASAWVDLAPDATAMPGDINGGVILPANGGNSLFVSTTAHYPFDIGGGTYLTDEKIDQGVNTVWVRSPQFYLDGSGDLTFKLIWGQSTGTAPANESAVAYNGSQGWDGLCLRDAITGAFVLSQAGTSTHNAYSPFLFTAAQLAGLDQTHPYTLDLLITRADGGHWISLDDVSIPGGPTLIAPPPPTGLAATPGSTVVGLSWTAATRAAGYNIKRSVSDGGSYAVIGTASTPTYTDNAVVNGTTYYYVVSATNSAGESADSTQVSATPQADLPPTPTGLTTTPGNSMVTLGWTAALGATGYNVKRSVSDGGGYDVIGTTTTPNYTDTAVLNDTTYYYVVSAINIFGESDNSTQASAKPYSDSLPVTSGLVFRVRADVGVETSGNNSVVRWADLIKANDLTPVVADNYPTLVGSATPNGSPPIHFAGPPTDAGTIGQALHHLGTAGLPTGTADRTVFMFGRYNYTAPIPGHGWGGFAYGNNAVGQCFGLVVQANSDALAVQGWGGGKDFVASVNGSTWMSQSATLSGSDASQTLFHYKNGTQIDTRQNMGYGTGTARIVLGVEIDETGFELMDVAEVLVYNRVLTDPERDQVETYLSDKWLLGPSSKQMLTFDFGALGSAKIDAANITIQVPLGTDVTALAPTYTFIGASCSPASGTALNFATPQVYTITALDNSTLDYLVTVHYPINYSFDGDSLQGWHNRVWDGTASAWIDLAPDATTMPGDINDGVILPANGGNSLFVNTTAHYPFDIGRGTYLTDEKIDQGVNTVWARSPQFYLDSSGDLTFKLIWGQSTGTPPANESAVLYDASQGWDGLCLRDVTTGDFVLTQAGTSTHNAYSSFSFTAAQLAGLNQTHAYTLDLLITRAEGGHWISLDDVSIPGTTTPPVIPQPKAVLNRDPLTGDVTVSWDSLLGLKYVLQSKADLSVPGTAPDYGWSLVFPGLASPVVGTGGVVSLTDYAVDAPHRFYRVLVLP